MSTSELAVSTITSPRSAPVRSRSRHVRHGYSYWHPRMQAAADFITIAFGLWMAHVIHPDSVATPGHWHSPLGIVGVALIVISLLAQLGAYSPQATPMNIVETEKLIRGISFALIIATAICLLAQARFASLAWSSGFVLMVLLVVQRDISHLITDWMRRRGYGVRRVLICGSQCYSQLGKLLTSNPHTGRLCVGFVHDMFCPTASATRQPGWLGPSSDLEKIAKERAVEEVVVAAGCLSQDEIAKLASDCERLHLRLSVALDILDGHDSEFHYEQLGSITIARYETPARISNTPALKRTIDIASSAILLILLSPVFVLTAILIKLGSKGPVFFRHVRIGKEGKRFLLWKFRSMRADAFPYARSPGCDSDSRLTRVGRVMRRLSIDELPQLINVLRGDMSLVGPRPEMPFLVEQYGPMERRRLRVKPGITGLWQISPARAEPIHENMEFDLFYIQHQNIFLDCAILLRTITAVIRGIGAT